MLLNEAEKALTERDWLSAGAPDSLFDPNLRVTFSVVRGGVKLDGTFDAYELEAVAVFMRSRGL